MSLLRRPRWFPALARRTCCAIPAAALAAVLAACGREPPPAPAPAPTAHRHFEVPEGVVARLHEQVRMRDGVRLDTDVYLPAAQGGPWPVVLIRTPYKTELGEDSELAGRLLRSGYALVQQHERGRFLSEGQVAMLSRAGEDGWDTLDWIAAQSWSNGRVGTLGCSSSAENQLKLATLGHPAHKAMIAYSAGVAVASVGPLQEQGNFWLGGVWQQGWFNYFVTETQKDWPQLPADLSAAERQRAVAAFHVDNRADEFTPADYDRVRLHLPMMEMARALGAPRTDFETYLARGPAPSAVWMQDRVSGADTVRVPGLWAEALYDLSARSTVAFFEQQRARHPAGTQSMLITNGRHCTFGSESRREVIGARPLGDARFDDVSRQMAFLDRWLKNRADAPPPPARPIRVYMAGANRWAEFDAVPWADGVTAAGATPTRRYWLSSAGHANTERGDGVLLDAAPATEAVDRYDYDPQDPVIARGGAISGVGQDQLDNEGAYDQRPVESRADVLVYTSAVLDRDLPVFGYVGTQLQVSSSAPDTDFAVKLVDVAPDGTAFNLADSIQRMRYREGSERAVFLQPGEIYRIELPPMLVANVFLKGHRVRLEVTSSHFPSYARNLNTAADPYTSREFQIAHNAVHHGAARVSLLRLPVVELP